MYRASCDFNSLIRFAAAFFLIAVLSFQFSSKAFAAIGINKQINFQGKLVDDEGLTVADSTYSVVFSLYDDPSAGNLLWTETDDVTTVNGIFRVSLGHSGGTALPGNVDFNADNIYLGIKVESDSEMTPRIRFTAVPYAFNAEKVAGLTVTDESGVASTSGSLKVPNDAVITLPSGTATLLAADGSIAGLTGTISSSVLGNSSLYIGTTQIALNRSSAAQGLTGITGLTPGANFTLNQNSVDVFTSEESGAVANTLYLKGGNVGVGSTDPAANLEVLSSTTAVASVSATTSGNGLTFTGNSSGSIIQSLRNGTMTIGGSSTGNITMSPLNGTGSVTIGSTTNGLVFDVASNGPTYYGTARPVKKIVLSPEYAGATLTAFNGASMETNITGSMTSDTNTSTDAKNYYSWSSTEVTKQYYVVAVRVTLPQDFSAWDTNGCLVVNYIAENATDNSVQMRIYNDSRTLVIATSQATSTSWNTISLDAVDITNWNTAGATAVIYLDMGAANSHYARIGDIVLTYKSKF